MIRLHKLDCVVGFHLTQRFRSRCADARTLRRSRSVLAACLVSSLAHARSVPINPSFLSIKWSCVNSCMTWCGTIHSWQYKMVRCALLCASSHKIQFVTRRTCAHSRHVLLKVSLAIRARSSLVMHTLGVFFFTLCPF